MKRFVSILMLMTAIGVHPLFAQPQTLRQAIHDFAKREIFPKLLEWKAEFDQQLEPADLERLNQLREQASQLRQTFRQQRRTLLYELRSLRQQQASPEQLAQKRAALRQLFQQHRDQMRPLVQEVRDLARKYQAPLKAIFQKAKPFVTQWHKELAALRQQWRTHHTEQSRYRLRKHLRAPIHFRPVIRFLLWNGAVPAEETLQPEGRNIPSKRPVKQQLLTQSSLALPATAVPPSSRIHRAVMVNLQGRAVYQADDPSLPLRLPSHSLPAGLYFLQLHLDNGTVQQLPVQVMH